MRIKALLLLFFLTIPFLGKAQKLGYSEPAVPSAEAAKLAQFSMSAPNLYTGAASFSVPIYSINIEGKDISFSFV